MYNSRSLRRGKNTKNAEDEFVRLRRRNARLNRSVRNLAKRNIELMRLLEIDDRTGLLRYRGFERRAIDFLRSCGNSNFQAIVFCDISGFKSVNDNYDYETGNKVLKRVSELLISHLRQTDEVWRPQVSPDLHGRWGGDEFVAFLQNLPGEGKLARLSLADICVRTARAVVDHEWQTLGVLSPVGLDIAAVYFKPVSGMNVYTAKNFLRSLIVATSADMQTCKTANKLRRKTTNMTTFVLLRSLAISEIGIELFGILEEFPVVSQVRSVTGA